MKKFYLIIFIGLLALTACHKKTEKIKQFYCSCKVNGKIWLPTDHNDLWMGGFQKGVNAHLEDTIFTINGVDSSTSIHIYLHRKSGFIENTSYLLNEHTNASNFATYQDLNNSYFTDSTHLGHILFSHIDTKNKTIEGIFSFVGNQKDFDSVVVTDGKFFLPY
jgi:hypothetical protein